MDTSKSNYITDQLLEAMNIIADKKINNLSFDKTILCTIVDDTEKEEGIYQVSFNDSQTKTTHFTAIAQEGTEYSISDNVYVNIPQNNFNNQKIIISKHISDQTTPINYIFPMERFIKILDIYKTESGEEFGLIANNPDQKEILVKALTFDYSNMLNTYDCLGVSADFQTFLRNYHPISGRYGLRFEFLGLKEGWETYLASLDDQEASTNNYNKNDYFAYKVDTFTSDEMYGDYYGYEGWTKQEKLINLQDFPYPIVALKIYFFQDIDVIEFKDYEDHSIPYTYITSYYDGNNNLQTNEKLVSPNILMSNLNLTLGYLIEGVQDKDLKLYTTSYLSYAESNEPWENVKNLKLRWLQQNEESQFTVIDNLEDCDDEFWKTKSIYLYKYTYGEDQPDRYAGYFWKEIAAWNNIEFETVEIPLYNEDGTRVAGEVNSVFGLREQPVFSEGQFNNEDYGNNPFELTLNITEEDKKNAFVRYKMLIVESSYIENQTYDENKNSFSYYTIEHTIYESNDITFNNQDQVASLATMSLIQGLSLECSDLSNGIYKIYGLDNKIIAQQNVQKMELQAKFDAINIEKLDAGDITIKWYYPKNSTMFLPPVNNETCVWDAEADDLWYIATQNINMTEYIQNLREKQLEENPDIEFDEDTIDPMVSSIEYTINSFYSSLSNNNIIRCEIERYGRTYQAEKEFVFGHSGNNGTNYSFDISLERAYNYNASQNSFSENPISNQIYPFLQYSLKADGTLNTEENYWIKVKPTLIYGNEQIEDENILNRISWQLETITSHSKNGTNYQDILLSNTTGSEIYIKLNIQDVIDLQTYCAVLRASLYRGVAPINDEEGKQIDEREVLLSTYLPIGVGIKTFSQNSNTYNLTAYDGGTSILYSDYGSDPVYYEGEHKLLSDNKKIEAELNWDIYHEVSTYSYVDENNENQVREDLSFYPTMRYVSDTNQWFLEPTSLYFSDLTKKISIQVTAKNSPNIILYSQPLLISQNAWGNQTINQWDGSLKIDEENNYVLASMLGAGRKNEDNTFSGVLMGLIGKDTDDAQTGIYGYDSGIQTYGFKEDGTAFIGVSGLSRIEFDGSSGGGTIKGGQNNLRDQQGNLINEGYTMIINLAQGSITATRRKAYQTKDELGRNLYYDQTGTEYYISDNKYYRSSDDAQLTDPNVIQSLYLGEGHYEYCFNAQDENTPLKIGEKFSVEWDGTVHMSGAVVGNVFEHLQDGGSLANLSTLEDLLLGLHEDYSSGDFAEMAERIAHEIAEAQARVTEDGRLSSELESERRERIESLQPNNLYNAMIETVNVGDQGYFLVTNKTYGTNTSQTQFLIEDDTSGTILVKNLIAEGIVSAYAGQFGGWNLLPGLMHYGFNTAAVQSKTGLTWYGDFFNNRYQKRTKTIDQNTNEEVWETIKDLKDLPAGELTDENYEYRLDPDESVPVTATSAFIYLGNKGNGVTISNFCATDVNDEDGWDITLADIDELEHIIFSLGNRFAVASDGTLYVTNGHFSGKITSSSGKIGSWYITEKGLGNGPDENSSTTYLYATSKEETIFSGINDNILIKIGDYFKVAESGTAYMRGAIMTNVDFTDERSDVPTDGATLEAIFKWLKEDYDASDEAYQAEMVEALSNEAQQRSDGDGGLTQQIGAEINARKEAFQPQNLYNSMIETVSIGGSERQYFLITNNTYGADTTQTQFAIEDAAHGTMIVKNVVAKGIVTGYAGSFGGWNLLPGLMFYGYGAKATTLMTKEGVVWAGDLFDSVKINGTVMGETEDGNTPTGSDWASGSVEYTIKSAGIEAKQTGAFIYLADNTGLSIKNFGSSGDKKIDNVRFLLGNNFAVDVNGKLYATAGDFSGTIVSKNGQIGSWYISENGLGNSEQPENSTVYLYATPNSDETTILGTTDDILLRIGDYFKVSQSGVAYMRGAVILPEFSDDEGDVPANGSTLEQILRWLKNDYDYNDSIYASEFNTALSTESSLREEGDTTLTGLIGEEASAREEAFQPQNLYNSMIETIDIGGNDTKKKYFLITNKTYGSNTTQTQFAIEDASSGTLVVKNVVAKGLITGYAGSFGGWNLLPGLMFYGYDAKATTLMTQEGVVWAGDLFTSVKIGDTVMGEAEGGNTPTGSDWASGEVTYTPKSGGIRAESTGAFIYLNDNNGLNITGFGAKSTSEIGKSISKVRFLLGNNFAVDVNGNMYCSGASVSGILTASHIQGELYNNSSIFEAIITKSDGTETKHNPKVYARGLSLNTTEENLSFWKNALYGGFAIDSSESVDFSSGGAAYTPKSYVGFLRGGGEDSNSPGNVFLGIKVSNNQYFLGDAANNSSYNKANWDATNTNTYYRAFIRFTGQAKFYSVSVGETKTDSNNAKLAGDTESVTLNSSTVNLITTYGIDQNGIGYFKNIKSNLTSDTYIGLTLNGAGLRSSTQKDYFWQNSFYTMRKASDTKHHVAFMRGYGPDSNDQTNVFLGSKTLEAKTYKEGSVTKYYEIGNHNKLGETVTGYGDDPWTADTTKSTVNYDFFIKYNGDAYFRNLSTTGIKENISFKPSSSSSDTRTADMIGLTWTDNKARSSTNKDYFWKNSLYTMRSSLSSSYGDSKGLSGYVGFIRGFGSNSGADNMTFIGAKETKNTLNSLTKNIEGDSGDYWTNDATYTFRIDIDGNAKFHTLEVEEAETSYTDGTNTVKSSRLLPKIYTASKGKFLKVNDEKKAEWVDLPTASNSAAGIVTTTSTISSSTGYTACPIIDGVVYYKDNNTTYSIFAGSTNSSSSKATSDASNPYIISRSSGGSNSYVQIKGSGYTSVLAKDNVITISSSGDGNTTYSIFAGSTDSSTSQATSKATNPYIILRSSGNLNSPIQIKGSGYTSVSAKDNIITISSSGDGNNIYYSVSSENTPGLLQYYNANTPTSSDSGWLYAEVGLYAGKVRYYYNTTSDRRLKKDFKDISLNDLNFYDKLHPIFFTWKTNNLNSYGFIAQDVEQLLKEESIKNNTLCSKDATTQNPELLTDGILYGLDSRQFHALHVAKNHQQDARIQSLESEVASLRAELEQLKREEGGK